MQLLALELAMELEGLSGVFSSDFSAARGFGAGSSL